MKLFVYCLANPVPAYVKRKTMDSLFNLEWPDPFEMIVARDDTGSIPDMDGKAKSITDKVNRGRELMLNGDCDAMLLVEADNILPRDTLLKLTRVDADVCYGLYVQRPSRKHRWMMRIGEDLTPKDYSVQFMRSVWNTVHPSDGLGFGCTLVHRRVMEKIAFRANGNLTDYHFAKDVKAAGFRQAHDCSVHVGHIMDIHSTVWPDPMFTYRIEKDGKA